MDLGLGHSRKELYSVLLIWGSTASQKYCQDWLFMYRHGGECRLGCASLCVVYRDDFLRWFHVDELQVVDVQRRLLYVHGVYTDKGNLHKWLRASVSSCIPWRTTRTSIRIPLESMFWQSCSQEDLQRKLYLVSCIPFLCKPPVNTPLHIGIIANSVVTSGPNQNLLNFNGNGFILRYLMYQPSAEEVVK